MLAMVSHAFLFIAVHVEHVQASEFLRARPQPLVERLSEESIRTTLLEEIEGSLGTSMSRKRSLELEAQLRPIFAALPKNEHGNLGHTPVRYALHRLFVLRHGWNIKGLDPNGESWNASSPTGVLKDQAPAYIHTVFEERLGKKGLGLHELVIMASTIEHMIHNEATGRLGAVFNVHNLLPTDKLTAEQGTEVLDTYMMAYIMAENIAGLPLQDARDLVQEMPDIFPAWNETQKFVRGIRADFTVTRESEDLDFSTLAKIVDVVGEHFGRFQNSECTQMKNALVAMEDRGTGRVKLADFYKPVAGEWKFKESVAYLRQLGALDETDKTHPSVIIPNYLQSESNCIASSGFYSICCMDEGEGLLGHLEEKIGAPEATSSTIAAIVANVASSSVPAPRVLPATLLKRLDDIAATHGGVVPLHSRLFSQWMHHAFPREFLLPHMSGTTSQHSPEEWLSMTGSEALATEDEMSQFSSASMAVESSTHDAFEPVELLPWSHQEELLVPRTPFGNAAHSGPNSSPLRKIMLLLAVGSVAFGVALTFKEAQGGQAKVGKKDLDNGKYFV
jgi:hypothetical protein